MKREIIKEYHGDGSMTVFVPFCKEDRKEGTLNTTTATNIAQSIVRKHCLNQKNKGRKFRMVTISKCGRRADLLDGGIEVFSYISRGC